MTSTSAIGENNTSARARTLPRVLASLDTLAISLAHLAGRTDIAAVHDCYRTHPGHAPQLLGHIMRTRQGGSRRLNAVVAQHVRPIRTDNIDENGRC